MSAWDVVERQRDLMNLARSLRSEGEPGERAQLVFFFSPVVQRGVGSARTSLEDIYCSGKNPELHSKLNFLLDFSSLRAKMRGDASDPSWQITFNQMLACVSAAE